MKKSNHIEKFAAARKLASAIPLLSADNNADAPGRIRSGAVRSIKDTFSNIERENEALRAQITSGQHVTELDPSQIDPSPFADRFSQDVDPAFDALKQSIAERGQEIPVLVRPHAEEAGRYQSAYGHRRVRAALALGRPVKAIVRPMSDDELIVAQGVENSAREDLSFIERALFALRLEQAGKDRSIVQQALAIDRAEASKLIAVAKAAPLSLIAAIGKAPKIGRGRWQDFAEAIKDKAALKRATDAAARASQLDSDERFRRAFAAAKKAPPAVKAERRQTIVDGAGSPLAHISADARHVKLSLAEPQGEAFARFLGERLPVLFDEFRVFAAHAAEDPDDT